MFLNSLLLSTIHYLFSQVHSYQYHQHNFVPPERGVRASDAFENISTMAMNALSNMQAMPSLSIGDTTLHMDAHGIDLNPLLEQWPTLSSEWESMCRQGVLGLRPLGPSHRACIGDFLRFLNTRVTLAKLESSHALVQLRNCTMRVLTLLFEQEVFTVLNAESVPLQHSQIHQLRSQRTGRKLRLGVLDKKLLLRKLACVHNQSAKETMLAVMQGHKGYAGVLQNVRNGMYERAGQGLLEQCRALSLHWDGATYSGLSVNIAVGLDCISEVAVHMRPVVDSPSFA